MDHDGSMEIKPVAKSRASAIDQEANEWDPFNGLARKPKRCQNRFGKFCQNTWLTQIDACVRVVVQRWRPFELWLAQSRILHGNFSLDRIVISHFCIWHRTSPWPNPNYSYNLLVKEKWSKWTFISGLLIVGYYSLTYITYESLEWTNVRGQKLIDVMWNRCVVPQPWRLISVRCHWQTVLTVSRLRRNPSLAGSIASGNDRSAVTA